jgi:hypothetical protein
MTKFIDTFKDKRQKEFYLYLIKNKAYKEIIDLYKIKFPFQKSILLNYLGLKYSIEFNKFCDNNNLDLIYHRSHYILRFNNVFIEYISSNNKNEYEKISKLENLNKEILLLKKQIKQKENNLEVYKNEYKRISNNN